MSLLFHDTCDRTLLLGRWLVLVGCLVERRILTRCVVEEWVVVQRRGELEHRGRDLLLLSFISSRVGMLTRGRGVHTRKADCERLQWAPWWLDSRRWSAGLLLLRKS